MYRAYLLDDADFLRAKAREFFQMSPFQQFWLVRVGEAFLSAAQLQMMKSVFRAYCLTSGRDYFNDIQECCKTFLAQSSSAKQTDQEIFKTRGLDDTTVERWFYNCD